MKLKKVASFKTIVKIGGGSFGKVYLAVDETSGLRVALKVEKKNEGHFIKEASFFTALEGVLGIPRLYLHDYDKQSNVRFLAMELVGPSIESLFIKCKRKFSLKTVAMLSVQMLERLQFVHDRGILHRDMKPHNFMVGIGSKQTLVYLGDFGLAKLYCRQEGHIEYKENKPCVGTARYVSINDHLGIQQSRRDDLESLGYVIIYLAKGGLPWQGLRSEGEYSRKEMVAKMKSSLTIEKLCEGLPGEFAEYIRYSRALHFDEAPDYAYVKRLFKNVLLAYNWVNDFKYDWLSVSMATEE